MARERVDEEGLVRFEVPLLTDDRDGATYVVPPFDAAEVFGAHGRIPIRGYLNGEPFRGTLMPREGGHWLYVRSHLREQLGIAPDAEVVVELEYDDQPRAVEPPDDFAAALAASADAAAAWSDLPYSHQHEWMLYLDDVEVPEMRVKRIAQMIAKLEARSEE